MVATMVSVASHSLAAYLNRRASAKLATLVARQRAGGESTPADLTSAGGWAKELVRRALSEADKAAVITTAAPPLHEALPWEQ